MPVHVSVDGAVHQTGSDASPEAEMLTAEPIALLAGTSSNVRVIVAV